MALDRVADLLEDDRAAVRELSDAVYPPAKWADWPGRRLEWAPHEWCVRIWDADGMLASYVGIVLRQARYENQPVQIGGIGGVKTHPAARGYGHARQGIQRAVEFFQASPAVAFALLVCEPPLIGYYARLGWQEFAGRLLITQRGVATEFTFNRVMVHGIRDEAPTTGTIDLAGPTW